MAYHSIKHQSHYNIPFCYWVQLLQLFVSIFPSAEVCFTDALLFTGLSQSVEGKSPCLGTKKAMWSFANALEHNPTWLFNYLSDFTWRSHYRPQTVVEKEFPGDISSKSVMDLLVTVVPSLHIAGLATEAIINHVLHSHFFEPRLLSECVKGAIDRG